MNRFKETKYVAGFWLSVAAAALALMSIGAGLDVLGGPVHPALGVMIGSLVLVVVLFGLFVYFAVRLHRRALGDQVPQLRLVAATLTLSAALVGGVVLFRHQNAYDHSCPAGAPSYACITYVRPGWVYGASLGIAFSGLAAAVGAIGGRSQRP